MIYSKKFCLVFVVIAPVLAILLVIFSDHIIEIALSVLQPCRIYTYTGYYCPGCGNTRSVIALLHGDILLSLRENILIIFSLVLFILFYLECIFTIIKKPKKLIPRKFSIWLCVMLFFFAYFIARNFIPEIAPI